MMEVMMVESKKMILRRLNRGIVQVGTHMVQAEDKELTKILFIDENDAINKAEPLFMASHFNGHYMDDISDPQREVHIIIAIHGPNVAAPTYIMYDGKDYFLERYHYMKYEIVHHFSFNDKKLLDCVTEEYMDNFVSNL